MMTALSGRDCAGRSSHWSRAKLRVDTKFFPLFHGASSMLAPGDKRRRQVREAGRRRRARKKKCRASYHCDADGSVLNMLVKRGYVLDGEVDDPLEVSAAITLFLADHAKADDL
jgi:hypothetical protein